ncbi:hypothetical protein ACVIJ6_002399 [Bradyrhizobium sp. USDA 4369]
MPEYEAQLISGRTNTALAAAKRFHCASGEASARYAICHVGKTSCTDSIPKDVELGMDVPRDRSRSTDSAKQNGGPDGRSSTNQRAYPRIDYLGDRGQISIAKKYRNLADAD